MIICYRMLNNALGYTEKHHIIPKSLGGSNTKDNLVRLTAREHFICHKLLVRMVSKSHTYKMAFAAWQQGRSLKYKGVQISSRMYESLKKELSKSMTGIKRKPFSVEHKRKMSESHKGRTHHRQSDETKQKISNTKKDRKLGVGSTNPAFNPTLYTFTHPDYGTFTGTQFELCQTYKVCRSNIIKIIKNPNRSCSGWRVVL